MTEVMNAFHPDYVRVHMPQFLSSIRTESNQYVHGVVNGGKSKRAREKKNKAANTINVNKLLEPREFYTFSRAGEAKKK